MKVEVVTVEEVKFKKLRWWSNWIDVCVFDHGYQGYLLQMRINRVNSKQFKAVKLNSAFSLSYCSAHAAGDLTQMKAEVTK
jgi:hypothetical protein